MLNSFWKYNIFWLLWLCLISYLSNAKGDGIPDLSFLSFKGADKLVHAIFYFNLFIAMSLGFSLQTMFVTLKSNKLLYPFLFSISWGALMEMSQLFVFTYRSAEWADMLANSIGATFGLFVCSILWKVKKIA